MDPRTESIKQEVDQTLENMADKMEQIENRVYGAARETVQNVKEKFDVRHLTAEHPWTMLGASVAMGFIAGNIGRSESRRKRHLGGAAEFESGRRFSYNHSNDPYADSEDEDYGMAEMVHVSGYERGSSDYGQESSGYRQGASEPGGREERPQPHHPSREIVRRSISRVSSRVKASAPSVLSSLKEHFGGEIDAIKKAALITVGNSLRGLIQQKLPQFVQEFDRARHGGHDDGHSGWQQSQQHTQGWSQGQGESRGSESRYGSSQHGSSQHGSSSSQYGSEGRYGSGNQYGGEYQGQSERYGSQGQQGQGRSGGSQGQGESRYGAQGQQGQGRYGSQGQGEGRYGGQGQQGQGQGQGQGRSGSQGQGEGRYGGQQTRGYNPDQSNIGSSVDNEHGNRDNEGGYGNSGHPTGRKGHN